MIDDWWLMLMIDDWWLMLMIDDWWLMIDVDDWWLMIDVDVDDKSPPGQAAWPCKPGCHGGTLGGNVLAGRQTHEPGIVIHNITSFDIVSPTFLDSSNHANFERLIEIKADSGTRIHELIIARDSPA